MPYRIRLYAIKAMGLAFMDVDLLGKRQPSDPYLRVSLGAYCVLCTVYCVLCGPIPASLCRCVLCTVYCLLCTVYCVLFTVWMFTVYCVLCTVWTHTCESL